MQLERADLTSSLYNIPAALHGADLVFNSPESLQNRLRLCSAVQVDMDGLSRLDSNITNHVDEPTSSDNDDCCTRPLMNNKDRQTGLNSDCCDCNIDLRRDLDTLRRQVNRMDVSMNNNLTTIVALLEQSINIQTRGRKNGSAETYVSPLDGCANTSV